MVCKRKTTSWSKFEYIFRSVVLQERKGNLVLFCSQAGGFWLYPEKTQGGVVTCSYSYSSVSVLFCTTLQLASEMSSLQMLPCNSKGNVFCFLGPPGRIRCETGMPPREMETPESALDTVVSVHGPFSNPHSRLQLAAKFGTIMQVSSLLGTWIWADLFFL